MDLQKNFKFYQSQLNTMYLVLLLVLIEKVIKVSWVPQKQLVSAIALHLMAAVFPFLKF